jgi:aryl-alcohol dehydrogenase-like predicted oxidoreductase
MEAAYECGVNFFDCAESYAAGESEIVMGKAIRKFGWNRNDLVISTKVGRTLVKATEVPTNKAPAVLGRFLWFQRRQQSRPVEEAHRRRNERLIEASAT